ncbi:MAG: hypothetical protein ACI4DO_03650 [Roseburia sp.]
MRKKWFNLKKGFSVAALVLATAGMMMCATTQAADIEKTRGRVNVDLSDFVLVHTTTPDKDQNTDKFGLVSQDSSNSMYKLHYKNSFTDRNNLGCTYRSGKTYDMTDVTGIELYGKYDTGGTDLLLLYVDPSPSTNYDTLDNTTWWEDVPEGISGKDGVNGTIWPMLNFKCKKNESVRPQSCDITQRYSDEYVFVGLSKDWFCRDAVFYIDNETIVDGGSQGCVNLILKKHNVGLLASEKLTHVVYNETTEASTEETYEAFSNVKIRMDDGTTCSTPDSNGNVYMGAVYRDEQVTLTYSLKDVHVCDLDSFKFYSDKNKENLIYEMDVTGKDNACTFTLTSSMIQKMEEKAGAYNLGDFYVEPVFRAKEATIDFSNVVVEYDGVKVRLSKENEDGSKEYILYETGTDAVIGTFYMNQAKRVGDDITIDYEPNENYDGDYIFSYYEYRMCESKENVNVASQNVTTYSEDKMDLVENIPYEGNYFWVRAHVKLKAEIKLEDKEVTFNSKEVHIDEATVTWPEGYQKPTGKITYHYYTDAACEYEMASGEYPVNAGTYYVKATLGADDYYEAAPSNTAKLVINKATPDLSNLRGESSIIYGDSISATNPTGTAKTVTGQTMEGGTFTWVYPDTEPTSAGTATAEVKYTPSEFWEENYTTATGTARITVDKATPTITLQSSTKVFDGQPPSNIPVTVTGVNNEPTGQKLAYEYYKKVGEQYVKLLQAPVDVGTYYVTVYTTSNTANYSYAETDKQEVTIQQRVCDLIQVPIDTTGNSVNVYVTNTVSGYKPEGQIKLELTPKSGTNIWDSTTMTAYVNENEEGRYYAAFNLVTKPSSGYYLDASYIPGSSDNYKINPNRLEAFGSSDLNHTDVELTYEGASKDITAKDTLTAISSCENVSTTWLNLSSVNDGDVVNIVGDNTDETITVKPENAGTETLVAYVTGTSGTGTKSWYLFYDITVKPADVTVSVKDKTVSYSGQPVVANAATVTYQGSDVEVTDALPVTYTYYSTCENGSLSGELEEPPVNAGTYYVQAMIEDQRNYCQSTPSVSKLIITQIEPTITLTDQTVTYDGKPHEPDSTVVTGIDGITKESEEASQIEDKGRFPAGSVSYKFDCDALNYHSNEPPVNAGTYTVTEIYISGDSDNYAQSVRNPKTATLTIEPAKCTIELDSMEIVYNGEPAAPNTLYFTGVDGKRTKTLLKKVTGKDLWIDKEGNTYVLMYFRSTDMFYSPTAPSDAGLYYVYAVRLEGGNYKRALSNRATLLIKPADIDVTLQDATKTYTGDAIDMATLAPATVTNQNGVGITDATVTYQYYADENAFIKIDAPVDAGTYYVQAFVRNNQNYHDGESGVQKIIIEKATPTLSGLQAEDIIYGTELGASEISGTATGVKGEVLNGRFVWAEPISHERRDVGSYELSTVFIPDESAARNYTEAAGNVNLKVKPFTPVIQGKDQAEAYNGEVQSLTPVSITGATGVPAPAGDVTYTYYSDENCTSPVTDCENGVVDAGNYYCKVEFASDTSNYTDASAIYKLEIEKANGVIALVVPGFSDESTSGEVQVKGVLAGVFDDPTGTVTIYQKLHDEEDSAYVPVAEYIQIVQRDGYFVFSATISLEKKIYDFKAVYNEGTKSNYNIADGKLEDVDMSKESQYIYFETMLITKEYGSEDFCLKVVDENNGPGEVDYYSIEGIGNSDAIKVSQEGTVEIEDTGIAFVIAEKAGNENYRAAYAIAVIRVTKAPADISLSDKTVTYTGQSVALDEAALTSHNKPIAENEAIPVIYTYQHVETGYILDREPVEAGEYKVSAYSLQNDHYQSSAESAEATLTIEKAKAKIALEVNEVDKENQTLALQGYLPGVFDYPSGTITLYRKLSGQTDDQYEVAAENVDIVMIEKGSYGFSAKIAVELNQTYDFKAVYNGDDVLQNYLIADGELTQIDIGEIVDDDDDSDNGDDPGDNEKDDPGKSDDGQKDDPGKNGDGQKDDPGQNNDAGQNNGVQDGDGQNNAAQNDSLEKGENSNQAVETGDAGSVTEYLLLLLTAMAAMVITGKRARR